MAIFYKRQVFAGQDASPIELNVRALWTRLSGIAVLLFAAISMIACGSTGGNNSGSNPPPPEVAVSISPTTHAMRTGETQQFTATVTGTNNTAVTWSATAGTITSSGLYTAPSSAGTYTVRATSVADTSKSAQATVIVSANPPGVSVSVSPATTSLQTGGTQQFSATVTGTSNTAVTWSATGGMITSSGFYTAPPTAGTNTVRATSVADPSKSGQATVTISTTPPPPGSTASSVTKDGITWTFSAPAQVGQFVNGDFYVVGPVTVSSISPAPTRSAPFRNGSVLNLPSFNDESGFDDRTDGGRFNASMRVYTPLDLHPGDTLVSSISVATIGSIPAVMRSSDASSSPVRTVSVLTVLDRTVDADAFRPSYCDRAQTIYHARNLNRQLLPSLPRPASTPLLSEFEGYLRRPWIDVNQFLFDAPIEYMPGYGREMGFAISYASLLLMLDFPAAQKEPLTNYLVQYGIDLSGCLEAGYSGWPAHGGHGSGRKLPIILAGVLLNEPRMKEVSTLFPNSFGEDMQTIYVTETPPAGTYTRAWQGATVVYGGHIGINGNTFRPGWGPYEHLQPRDWLDTIGEDYRRCCTSVAWVGQALTMKLLHAESFWNHPAFFDYVDRWMGEDDTAAVAEIRNQNGSDYSADWQRQRQTRFFLQGAHPKNTFIDDMWSAYRSTVP